MAEKATYGDVRLSGLLRAEKKMWEGNQRIYGAVCNVNGPDGFLSVRNGPGSDFKAVRKLKRLAVVQIDIPSQKGPWMRVVSAQRRHTPQGQKQAQKDLNVRGWVHDGFICFFSR